MTSGAWNPSDRTDILTPSPNDQHLLLRIELAIRAVLADRLTHSPGVVVDRVLMVRVKERERIERAGWFN